MKAYADTTNLPTHSLAHPSNQATRRKKEEGKEARDKEIGSRMFKRFNFTQDFVVVIELFDFVPC